MSSYFKAEVSHTLSYDGDPMDYDEYGYPIDDTLVATYMAETRELLLKKIENFEDYTYVKDNHYYLQQCSFRITRDGVDVNEKHDLYITKVNGNIKDGEKAANEEECERMQSIIDMYSN